MKVVALSVPYPGVCEWFRHGHEEKFWEFVRLDGHGPIPDADTYLFGAWHPVYESIAAHYRENGSKVVVAWSSSPTEMDTAHIELEYIADLVHRRVVDAWACLHPGLVGLFANLNQRAIHLPAPVHVDPCPSTQPPREGIGFYAPATLKKNIVTQLLAVQEAQRTRDDVLYTNLDSYATIMDTLGINHTLQPWVPRSEHLTRLASRRVVLCASHAESWCYGAIDALSVNTPVIGSPTIPWIPRNHRVRNPNDPAEIARHITTENMGWVGTQPRRLLERVANTQNHAVRQALQSLSEALA